VTAVTGTGSESSGTVSRQLVTLWSTRDLLVGGSQHF
jgi:hypothetical protein